ncbi:MAG: extracellular solute-binding protein [Clostridiales bacterium]|jgi:putative aldouronate transport system substrate-binding protein|nr:extracellular solute-binding protein [Clostridiales bacterium]
MNRKLKLLALVIALCVSVSLISSCKPQANDVENQNVSGGRLFDENTEINIVIGSHASWPYSESWKFWQYFKEAVGGRINVKSIPNTELATKISLMMASPDALPDLLHVTSKTIVDTYALSGAFVAVDDNPDKMPNYKKLWENVPDDELSYLMGLRRSGDGKMYYPQLFDAERMGSNQTWMYRKDVFEKNDIRVPETLDELYNTALKLKELYPESYPVSLYNYNIIATIGPQWKPYFQHYVYYDYNAKKWSFGATEQTMLDIVEYLIKLREKNLVAPDFLTMNTKSWEELVSTDRGFIMPTYVTRIDFFNKTVRSRNPDYTWAPMMPPRADTETGQNRIARVNPDSTGYVVCNTGDAKRIENAFKLLDWMYTDEATMLLSWGKEGETYEVIDGKKQFIVGENETPRDKYGALTYGLYQRVDPEVVNALISEEQVVALDKSLEYMEDRANPKFWIAFTDEELDRREELRPAIEAYTDEMLSKFILGMVPLTEWDSFQKYLKDLGVEELLSIHEKAYNRITKS